jgi:hypothetical protein
MNDNWKPTYKGYGIVAGTDLHNGTANFTITQPGAQGQPEMVYEGRCEVGYSDDDDVWDAAHAAARAYIDAELPALA